jgi:hypothetical protein
MLHTKLDKGHKWLMVMDLYSPYVQKWRSFTLVVLCSSCEDLIMYWNAVSCEDIATKTFFISLCEDSGNKPSVFIMKNKDLVWGWITVPKRKGLRQGPGDWDREEAWSHVPSGPMWKVWGLPVGWPVPLWSCCLCALSSAFPGVSFMLLPVIIRR